MAGPRFFRRVKAGLAASAALLLCCTACHWPYLPLGGVTSSAERAYRLIGLAAPQPGSTQDGPYQELAEALLRNRWSEFGLHQHWGAAKTGRTDLIPGSFASATEVDGSGDSSSWPYPFRPADPLAGETELAINDSEATWTIHPADTAGATALQLRATFNVDAANDAVQDVKNMERIAPGILQSAQSFAVEWVITGSSAGSPFTAHFTQRFFAQRSDYGTPI